ncbi:hypothetical protein TNCV_1400141 [Trichonephila clavipes]|nr:hypothetical protein TNCV_1400141 [Trichonephila clavipes]
MKHILKKKRPVDPKRFATPGLDPVRELSHQQSRKGLSLLESRRKLFTSNIRSLPHNHISRRTFKTGRDKSRLSRLGNEKRHQSPERVT